MPVTLPLMEESMANSTGNEFSNALRTQLSRATERQFSVRAPEKKRSAMRRLADDVDRFLAEVLGSTALAEHPSALPTFSRWPKIDVFRSDTKVVVRADVPGVDASDLRVEVVSGRLVVSGERRTETEERDGDYYRTERIHGSFRRVIPLPAEAEVDTGTATFKDGVLNIELDILPRARTRTLDVMTSH